MPRIADSMEGMDVSLLDDEKWQKLDSNFGATSEHHEDHVFKKAQKPRIRTELRSAVTKYLTDKLAKKLKMSSIRMPWSIMKTGDIINWPSDVRFIPVNKLNTEEVQRLYSLTKEEYQGWERLYERHGVKGLRTTRLQNYR